MMRRLLLFSCILGLALSLPRATLAVEEVMLVHLRTSLERDDAQICVAYNVIWAALMEGKKVRVLVDSDAVYTYKVGWLGKDGIEGYELPETLRMVLSEQFAVPLGKVPKTYGEYLLMLKGLGAEFYVNAGMLVVSGIGTPEEPLKKISAKFFRPVTLKEMVRLRAEAGYYVSY